ncbi:hypothetical protein AVEN_42246-1 [Araneus ventricosus]|uniref:Uncharacterized protein n=1 Tax=Araneus ventricosus TaxID=182803 RepID=A0A4Y2AYQ2_ARAVE|nr:hypothetical protein AVEN_42246-1 [Araneus ventricosus]
MHWKDRLKLIGNDACETLNRGEPPDCCITNRTDTTELGDFSFPLATCAGTFHRPRRSDRSNPDPRYHLAQLIGRKSSSSKSRLFNSSTIEHYTNKAGKF